MLLVRCYTRGTQRTNMKSIFDRWWLVSYAERQREVRKWIRVKEVWLLPCAKFSTRDSKSLLIIHNDGCLLYTWQMMITSNQILLKLVDSSHLYLSQLTIYLVVITCYFLDFIVIQDTSWASITNNLKHLGPSSIVIVGFIQGIYILGFACTSPRIIN